MKRFRFRAVRSDGSLVTGMLAAHGADDVNRILADRGLSPLRVTEAEASRREHRPPARRQMALIFRSLASLVESGAPLSAAVAATESMVEPLPLKDALKDVRRLLGEGQTLADALRQNGLASGVTTGMLRSGEQGGLLRESLIEVADYLEQEAEAAARLAKSLVYPSILLITGSASIVVIVFMVLPRFVDLLRDAGQTIPRVASLTLAVGAFVRRYGIGLTCIGAVGAWMLWSWVRVPANESRLHACLLRVPLLGRARWSLATARFSRTFGLLLRAGTPVITALETARNGLTDRWIQGRLERAASHVAGGQTVASSLAESGALLPAVVALIRIGENSGQLGEMAVKAATVAARDAERRIDAAITLIEPMLVLMFGAGVAGVAAILFQTVYSLRPGS